ncbi:MAG: hypothetical protein ACMG6S_11865 [Byssovorax sp.]
MRRVFHGLSSLICGLARAASGWINDGSGELSQRNVALWIKKPQ